MDISALTTQILSTLHPALPYLQAIGTGAATKIGQNIADDVKRLWDKLHSNIAANPKAQKAFEAVIAKPDDASAASDLRLQLALMLQSDPAFASDIEKLLTNVVDHGATAIATAEHSIAASDHSAVATGDRSIAVAGNISGSVFSTGDNSTINH
jgi:enoyl reductase-like protein